MTGATVAASATFHRAQKVSWLVSARLTQWTAKLPPAMGACLIGAERVVSVLERNSMTHFFHQRSVVRGRGNTFVFCHSTSIEDECPCRRDLTGEGKRKAAPSPPIRHPCFASVPIVSCAPRSCAHEPECCSTSIIMAPSPHDGKWIGVASWVIDCMGADD